MRMNDLPQGEKYIKSHRFHKRWHKVLMFLSSIVAFCTVYALILPASGAHTYRRLIYRGVVCAENGSGLYAGSPGNSPSHC